jgi:hypothetical protein
VAQAALVSTAHVPLVEQQAPVAPHVTTGTSVALLHTQPAAVVTVTVKCTEPMAPAV